MATVEERWWTSCRSLQGPNATAPRCTCERECLHSGRKLTTLRTWDDAPLDALEPVLAKFRDSAARREGREMIKAVRLAPTLEVCEALLRDEPVPKSRLDQEWLSRYGVM